MDKTFFLDIFNKLLKYEDKEISIIFDSNGDVCCVVVDDDDDNVNDSDTDADEYARNDNDEDDDNDHDHDD
jgi:hypothetical protein